MGWVSMPANVVAFSHVGLGQGPSPASPIRDPRALAAATLSAFDSLQTPSGETLSELAQKKLQCGNASEKRVSVVCTEGPMPKPSVGQSSSVAHCTCSTVACETTQAACQIAPSAVSRGPSRASERGIQRTTAPLSAIPSTLGALECSDGVPHATAEVADSSSEHACGDVASSMTALRLRVTIVRAVGLEQLNLSGKKPWCVSRVMLAHGDIPHTSWQTRKVVKGGFRPVWGESHTFECWWVGESLEISVHDEDSSGGAVEGGRVKVPSVIFFPNGFEGGLPFRGFDKARVYVNIEPIGRTGFCRWEQLDRSPRDQQRYETMGCALPPKALLRAERKQAGDDRESNNYSVTLASPHQDPPHEMHTTRDELAGGVVGVTSHRLRRRPEGTLRVAAASRRATVRQERRNRTKTGDAATGRTPTNAGLGPRCGPAANGAKRRSSSSGGSQRVKEIDVAAMRIQAVWRGQAVRRAIWVLHETAKTIQRCWKETLNRRRSQLLFDDKEAEWRARLRTMTRWIDGVRHRGKSPETNPRRSIKKSITPRDGTDIRRSLSPRKATRPNTSLMRSDAALMASGFPYFSKDYRGKDQLAAKSSTAPWQRDAQADLSTTQQLRLHQPCRFSSDVAWNRPATSRTPRRAPVRRTASSPPVSTSVNPCESLGRDMQERSTTTDNPDRPWQCYQSARIDNRRVDGGCELTTTKEKAVWREGKRTKAGVNGGCQECRWLGLAAGSSSSRRHVWAEAIDPPLHLLTDLRVEAGASCSSVSRTVRLKRRSEVVSRKVQAAGDSVAGLNNGSSEPVCRRYSSSDDAWVAALRGCHEITKSGNSSYVGRKNCEGQYNGYGVLRGEDGTTYAGQWKAGFREGHGTLFFEGGVLEGQWKESMAEGIGIIRFRNGDRFKGEFRGNRKHGEGTYYWKDGSWASGTYSRGNKVGIHVRRRGSSIWEWEYSNGTVAVARTDRRHGDVEMGEAEMDERTKSARS
eukprot:TRINITY_DN38379_c0_g1_i1.p1 TRINITY_DN38379_c0_g1~~TRINITY_DN38379_c0_g1_i1.p1  ORF type:complete len:978 (-),score=93.08 TRINITY_DN38379_c0_g1_i1:175-3108(-)